MKQATNKMEKYFDINSAIKSLNSSKDMYESDPSFMYGSSLDSELNDLTATFQDLSIDVDGMVRELFESNIRDTDSIRQDFIRNGIDSSITESFVMKRFPPPGFGATSKWPLSLCDDNGPSAAANPEGRKINDTEKRKSINSSSLSIRRKRAKENDDYCVFCYNNREEQETYLGHSCRDDEGFVVCPKLRKYVCPYCQATGRLAHTKKYCPKKPIITPDDLQGMIAPFGGQSTASGRRGKKSIRF